MRIGEVDLQRKILVIAEIGNNHEGSFDRAVQMVRLAARCGVDAVKFQTFRTELFCDPRDRARHDRLKSFELGEESFRELARISREEGRLFLSTPLDLPSAQFLEELVPAYKIASGDNTFDQLLEVVASSGKPLIVSTGLVTLDEIGAIRSRIRSVWDPRGIQGDLAFLHCVCSYPVPPEYANLRAISTMIHELPETIGYSDHTIGITACVAAAALGARIIEKHFTHDKTASDFRDHQLSADPEDMTALVRMLREIETMLGTGEKTRQECELALLPQVRRSLVSVRALEAGALLEREHLAWLRPAGGLSPSESLAIPGRRLHHRIEAGHRIVPSDLEPPPEPLAGGSGPGVGPA